MPRQVLDDLEAAGYSKPQKGSGENKRLKLVKTYNYDKDNRLLSWDQVIEIEAIQFPVENVSYTYDENGNRRQEQRLRIGEPDSSITHYSYDYEDRLTNLEYINRPNAENILNAAFEYNGNGLRTKAVEGDIITRFLYDGRNIVLETDGLGVTQRSYTRALGFPGGIGGLIAQKSLQKELVGEGKNKRVALVGKNHYYH